MTDDNIETAPASAPFERMGSNRSTRSRSSSRSSEDEDDGDRLSAADGLSADVLAALLQFQAFNHSIVAEDERIPETTACATYTLKDSQTISETYRRLQAREDEAIALKKAALVSARIAANGGGSDDNNGNTGELLPLYFDLERPVLRHNETLGSVLASEGVVRIDHVLDEALCDRCLLDLNAALLLRTTTCSSSTSSSSSTLPPSSSSRGGVAEAVDINSNTSAAGIAATAAAHATTETAAANSNNSTGFGDVYSRSCRHDMYLRNEGTAGEALHHMLHRGTELANLFQELCLPIGTAGTFHEFAALMTDSGAASQPVHPDSHYAEHAPLWTCFVALQDVEIDMGPTIFLTKTNTAAQHECFTGGNEQRDLLLASSEYRRSVLRKGDCAVMDSRTLHFGDKNYSSKTAGGNSTNTIITDDSNSGGSPGGKRRVLLYFTIRNPLHSVTGAVEDYPPCGSKWADLHMSTHDFLE